MAFFIRIFILVVTLTLPSFAISKKKWTADKCKVVLNYVQKPYKNLYKNLLRKNKKKIKSRYKKLLRMDDFLCDDSKERAIVMRFMEDVLSVRNNKVALMSQLGGDINTASHSITTSMQSYIKSHNSNVQLSVMDTGYDYKSFMKQLAYAVMVLDVNFVVLGPGRYSVHQAKKTLHQLRLPTLVLSNDKGSFASKYSFHVFPNLDQMTTALLKELELQKKFKLALVSSKLSVLFVQSIKKNLKYFPKMSILVEHDFNPDEYQSMDKTVRSLLKLNPEDQPIEYKKLALLELDNNQEKAKTFDAAFQLEAIKEFDAVVFPDNFKSLQHFVRTLKYFRSGPIDIAGSQKWRSKELVSPLPKILETAMFVDYVGYYNMLPKNVGDYALDKKDHSFVGASDVSNIDFKLIGTRAAEILSKSVMYQSSSRTMRVGQMLRMISPESEFFSAGRVFDEKRHTRWPSFLFKMSEKKLNLFRIR